MQLPSAGREYAHITFTALTTGAPVEASVDGATWLPVTVDQGGTTGTVLLRGPEFVNDSTPSLLVPAPSAQLVLRAVDDPETVIRGAGTITIV